MESKFFVKLCFVLALLFVPIQVLAVVGPQNITNTAHNLGALGAGAFTALSSVAGGTEEVCVFCHTPHNASPEKPLWNRYSSSGSKLFLTYTGSYTLTAEVKGSGGISANSVSRLCLSCHDGTTALNALVNSGRADRLRPEMDGDESFIDSGVFLEGEGAYLGTNLTNMHPINFNYDLAQTEEGVAGLDLIANVKVDLKFFDDNGDGTANYLECPTCHDPHVDYGWVDGVETGTGDVRYKPFLRKPNVSSTLCLTCHNK